MSELRPSIEAVKETATAMKAIKEGGESDVIEAGGKTYKTIAGNLKEITDRKSVALGELAAKESSAIIDIAAAATEAQSSVNAIITQAQTNTDDALQTFRALNPRGAWTTSTAYDPKDLYTDSGVTYIVVETHTSTTVADDLAAGDVAVYQGDERLLPEVASIIKGSRYVSNSAAIANHSASSGAHYDAGNLRKICDQVGLSGRIVIPEGQYDLGGGTVETPVGVAVTIRAGALIKNGTLVINGDMATGLYRVFDTDLVVRFGLPIAINTLWYADSITGINQAVASCWASVNAGMIPTLVFGRAYSVASAVDVLPHCNLKMEHTLAYTGNAGGAFFQMGQEVDQPGTPKINCSFNVSAVRAWDVDAIGLKLVNMYNSRIAISESMGFKTTAQLIGVKGRGFAYNKIDVGRLRGFIVGLELTNSEGGWINENTFEGGDFSPGEYDQYSDAMRGLSRYGVKISSKDGGYTNNNSNVFKRPCFQMGQVYADPGEALPILIEHGTGNSFLECRTEGNGPHFARTLNTSRRNTFTTQYGEVKIDHAGIYASSITKRIGYPNAPVEVFRTGVLAELFTLYDNGGLRATIMGMFSQGYTDNYIDEECRNIKILDNGDIIPSSSYQRGIGVFVDTRHTKRFIRHKQNNSDAMRMYITPYDADGNVLDGSATPRVRGGGQMEWTTWYNGAHSWKYSDDMDEAELAFEVAEEVQRIKIVFAGPIWQGFSLQSLDGFCDVSSGLDIVSDQRYAYAPPKFKRYNRGLTVNSLSASSGGKAGWICVKSLSTALTVAGASGHTSVTVGSISGVADGDDIGVVLDDKTIHWTTVNGAPSGSAIPLSAALTGAAAVANAVYINLFKASGAID